MNKVSIIGAQNYDVSELIPIIKAHFENLGGIDKFIKKGMKVLIKPNLIMRKSPDSASITHPAFIEAIARVVMETGADVIIADSPGGPNNLSYLKSVYNNAGMTEVSKNTNCKLNLDLSSVEINTPKGKVCHSFKVLKCMADADVIISAAKLKTHGLCFYTGAVKNMFGAVPGLMKAEFHMRFPDINDFNDMIIDLCEGVKPAISFMDGIMAMEGNGPSGGIPRFTGCTLASISPYSLDLAASYLIGYKTNEVPTIKEFINRGFCPDSIDKLEISGDGIEKFCAFDFKKPDSFTKGTKTKTFIDVLFPGFLKNHFTPRPVVNKNKCIACGDCAVSCPAKVIAIIDKKANIDYNGCIKCFCCQELCPAKAIDIKRRKFFDI